MTTALLMLGGTGTGKGDIDQGEFERQDTGPAAMSALLPSVPNIPQLQETN